ncbi:MAG: simple sugar transport system permease protein [Thermoleophilaceae bacterium]|nr:simple sugar transport system permease protein [Thermoleophilaceae bacterium]
MNEDAEVEPASKGNALAALLSRPELGAVAGAAVVFTFFAVVAGDQGFLTKNGAINYLEVAAQVGVLASAVTLLMIAGEFDLSVGSMIGAAGVLLALPVTELGWHLWLALPFTFAAAACIGLINGLLVVRTGVPAFIVTLAALFILRGVTIGVTGLITDSTQVVGVREALGDDPLLPLFAGEVAGLPVSIAWWLGLTALGAWLLSRTRFGNWALATGGDADAARSTGVPVRRVKVLLFCSTALAAALVGVLVVLGTGSADVLGGELKEFEAITAAVIGGTLLTGGYGSVVGAAFGALIFGMVSQGIFFTGVAADWFQSVLGAMLLAAVLVNQFARRRALEARR